MYVLGGLESNSIHTSGKGHADNIGANGISIPVHGIRTILFKMVSDKNEAVGITFTVCDVQAPNNSVGQMLKRGYECALTRERMELQLGKVFQNTHSSRRTSHSI